MSATLPASACASMRISAENFAAIQTLTTAARADAARAARTARRSAATVCDRRLLWRFGISGDRPIVLVSAGVGPGPRPAALAGAGAAPVVLGRRRLRPGRRQPRAGVLPDAAAARDRRAARSARRRRCSASPAPPRPALSPARSRATCHADELATLRALARVRLNADGRPLAAPRAGARRACTSGPSRSGRRRRPSSLRSEHGRPQARPRPPPGEFAPAGGEFRFDVSALLAAGAALDQRARQSGLRRADHRGRRRLQLGAEQPPQHADAVVERPGRRPGRRVVPAAGHADAARPGASPPSAGGDTESPSTASRTARATASISHRRGALDVSVTWCVDRDERGQAGAAAARQPRPQDAAAAPRSASPSGSWARNRADRGTP